MVDIERITTRHSQLVDVDTPHRISIPIGACGNGSATLNNNHVSYSAAAEEAEFYNFQLPKSWTGKKLKVSIRWNGTAAGVDDVYWRFNFLPSGENEYWDDYYMHSGTDLIEPAHADANKTKNLSHTFSTWTLRDDDTNILELKRLGADALDTYAGDTAIHSIILEAVD